jgi:hypothetical protein
MADESGMQASSSLQQGEEPEEARAVTAEDKAGKRRAYYAAREMARIEDGVVAQIRQGTIRSLVRHLHVSQKSTVKVKK